LDPVQLWARRTLTFADLPGKNFTIGSFRTLTILPLLWLKIDAKPSEQGNLIRWEVAQEKNNMVFEVYRSQGRQKEWGKIGLVTSLGNSDTTQDYEFLDTTSDRFNEYFYRIRQVDWNGKFSWSEVARVSPGKSPAGMELMIYPNPYSSGDLQLLVPEFMDLNQSELIIQNFQGKIIRQAVYKSSDLTSWIQRLPPGLYFISLVDRHHLLTGKLIKN
jgi:hypothetical protein